MIRDTKGKSANKEITEELNGFSRTAETSEKFKEVYKSLFNSSESQDGMELVEKKMSEHKTVWRSYPKYQAQL